MKKILFAISALALLTGISTSCQKEENGSSLQDNQNNNELTITATIADNGTKVAYAEDGATHALKPTWEVDDIIIGFDGSKNTYGYKVTAVNEGVAKLAIITSGDYAGTATTNPADGAKMYMFYAPGMKPSDIWYGKTLTVNIAHQSKDVVPALMMASGTVSSSNLTLSFENKCAIIGIKNPTMAAASADYTSITLYGTGIYTDVTFILDDETLAVGYSNPGTITKAVNFTSGEGGATSGVTYIAVCPQETPTDLTFITNYLETFEKTGKTMAAGNYYYMTPTFAGGHTEGLLPGVFSVGDTKYVGFSKGNLYYDGSAWKFENNQYDYRTYENFESCIDGSKSDNGTPSGHWGSFGWSTASTTYGMSTSDEPSDYSGDFVDWGNNAIANGGNAANLWSTLSGGYQGNWYYLFTKRGASTVNGVENARYCKATVNNVPGMILFPDNYTHPSEVTLPAAAGINKSYFAFDKVSYDVSAWTKMESAGCVFLPAAGHRTGDYMTEGIGSFGYYWSSTFNEDDEEEAYLIEFYEYEVEPQYNEDRHFGHSVRLVSVAE